MEKLLDDIELTYGIQHGDEAAFRRFFDRYYQPLLAYIHAFHHSRAESEDIVQQAFATVWIHREQLDPAQSPKGYLYAVAYRGFIDLKRKQGLKTAYLDDIKKEVLGMPDIEIDELTEIKIQKLKSFIDQLPERCREILLLSKMQGLKYQEIADKLNLSKKTVEAQMRIAYKKIREEFGEN